MKLETSILKLTSSRPLRDALKHLMPGARLSAHVLQRTSPTRAILEIKGLRVTAEFVKGVPMEGRIGLVLESRDGDALVFRMAAPRAAPPGGALFPWEHALFNPAGADKPVLLGALRALQAGKGGIFELNAMVLDPDGRGRSGLDRYKELLNKMKNIGIKHEVIKFFSSLFTARGGTLLTYVKAFLAQLYRKTGNNADGQNPHQPWAGEYPPVEDEIDRFIKDIEEVFRAHGGMDSGFLCDLIDFSSSQPAPTAGGAFLYEMPLPDGETGFALVMGKDQSLAFCLDLSGLGHLEGILRETDGGLAISIYCDSEAAREELNGDLEGLSRLVEASNGRRPQVRVLLMKDVIAGLAALLQGGDLAGSLDIKA